MSDYFQASMPASRIPENRTMIRAFHASPNTPAVDVYLNDNPVVRGLAYKQFSEYLTVASGNYNFKVYPSGQTTMPVIDTNFFIPGESAFNVAAIGTLPNVSLYPIPEPVELHNSGKACVRFVHLSPNAPAVDVKLPDGTTVFGNIAYKGISDYTCVNPGTYTFRVTLAGTNNTVLTVPNVRLTGNGCYTIYAVGLVGMTPPLEAVLASEPR